MSKMNYMLQGVLFLVFGIPGLFALLGGSVFFADFLAKGDLGKAMISLLATVFGALGVLVGIGKTHEPAFLIVFFSFPVVLFLTSYIWPGDKGIPILAGAGVAVGSNILVQRYYRGRKRVARQPTDR